MALSWNEIKDRALNFSKEWADTSNEEADAKPFLVEFFNVFGISSKRVATFEHKVKKLNESDGYIDLLWKGTILIEMKSRGKNLDKAYIQAIDYTHGLKQHELPKYILVSDFEHFRLYDLEDDKHIEFKLNELVSNVQHFGYILGYQKKVYKEQDPANIKAAELMGKLIAAETLSYFAEQIQKIKGPDVAIIAMGDFNDEPFNRALSDYALSVRNREKVVYGKSPYFFNLMWPLMGKRISSYVFDGHPLMIDQFMVSKGIAQKSGKYTLNENTVNIETYPGMTSGRYNAPVRFGQKKPNLNGFSDHLPISFHLTEK